MTPSGRPAAASLPMNKTPLLTIVIPTYNRGAYLSKLLPALWQDVERCRDDVRIVVSNNASTDDTQARLEQLRDSGIELEIVCRPTNIGPDRNFSESLLRVDTKYCWLLGDDDVPLPGALARIVAALKAHEPALLYLRSAWYEDAFGPEAPASGLRIADRPVDHIEFAARVNYWVTFISGIILDAELYRRIAPTGPPAEYLASNMVQLHWVLNLLNHGKSFLLSDDVMIKATGNNSGGYSILQIFAINFPRLVDALLGASSRSAQLIKRRNEFSNLPGLLFNLRFANLGNFKGESVSHELEQGWSGSRSTIALYRTILTGSRSAASAARGVLKLVGKSVALRDRIRLRARRARRAALRLRDRAAGRLEHLAWRLRGAAWRQLTDAAVGASASIGPGGQYRGLRGVRLNGAFFAGKRCRIELYEKHGAATFMPRLWLGNGVSMENDCHIGVIDRVELHDGVMLASRVYISDHSHGRSSDIADAPSRRPLHSKGPVVVERNVWIGEGATILPGVRIGEGAIVGANAVVTRDVPPMTIVVGAPARVISNRTNPQE